MRGRGCAPPRCAVRGARSPASRWSRCNHIPRQLCTRGRSGQSTRIITKFLGRIPTALGPGVVAQAEEALAGYAMTMAPEQLEAVGHRILAHLNSDGNLTDDADRQRRRGLGMGREGVDLMSELTATLTPACRAKLDAVFAKLACPGAATGPEAGGPADAETVRSEPGAAAVAADTRSQHQRNHDALEALCDLVLGGPRLGSHRGMPVTAIVTMTLIDLERGIGQATTASPWAPAQRGTRAGGRRNTGCTTVTRDPISVRACPATVPAGIPATRGRTAHAPSGNPATRQGAPATAGRGRRRLPA